MLPDFKRYMAQGTLRVEAKAPNDTGAPSAGQIDFIDNAVDPTTGTIKVKGTFPNDGPPAVAGPVRQRQRHADDRPERDRRADAAVQTGQQGTFVFVIKADKTVELRPVDGRARRTATTRSSRPASSPARRSSPTASCASCPAAR